MEQGRQPSTLQKSMDQDAASVPRRRKATRQPRYSRVANSKGIIRVRAVLARRSDVRNFRQLRNCAIVEGVASIPRVNFLQEKQTADGSRHV